MRVIHLLAASAIVAFAPALAWAQQPCSSNADSVVDEVFRQVLERPARSDANAFAERLRNGQVTVREIVRQLAKSPEYRQRFPTGTGPNERTDTVSTLYRRVLAREPDPGGLQDHVQALARGNDINAVIDALINSPEYQQKYGENTVPGGRITWCRSGFGGEAATRPSFDPASRAAWTADMFRQIDRNGDDRITSNEWYHSPDDFRQADRNRDGSLTLNEFTSAGSASDRDDRFESLDRNRNGRIERSEWVGSQDAFDWLDRNRDNVLSREEVVGESNR